MGAAGMFTKSVKLGTRVAAPLGRCYRAIIAQAFATLDYLFPGQIVLGLGTGEAMNVKPLGHRWPPYPERLQRLRESIEIVRMLWKGEFANYEGEYYKLDTANLHTKPKNSIPLFVAAKGARTALLAGKYADGIDTVSDPRVLQNEIIPNVRKGAKELDRNPEDIMINTGLSCSYHENYEKVFRCASRNASWLHHNIYSMDIWDP
jgi:coenzyme F420-dependent glucose-6-phosphate dehydrogenase